MAKQQNISVAPTVLPSSAELDAHNLKNLTAVVERLLATARDEIKQFSTHLIANPAYAMECSREAFEAAAQVQVYSWVNHSLQVHVSKGGKSYADLISKLTGQLQDNINTAARNPVRSTSPTACLMAQAILEEQAITLELVGSHK